MQKSLQFFAQHAEKFALATVVYFFAIAFFADSLGSLVAYTWPALLIGVFASAIIAMKNMLEIQQADREAQRIA